ncbi:hypothetical protein JD292_03465 [Leucobacter sp. CSA2]|uniref:DUF4261 domain-containing protein n=1 Tax=Leucobacter edaphi TaxID=2796472 RepID=A0A934QAH7_9MICO|nr:hypothetical protein [Leucobacter edaphi]MBK0421139.1 hypothetical protein [Leucobacter edaphi]
MNAIPAAPELRSVILLKRPFGDAAEALGLFVPDAASHIDDPTLRVVPTRVNGTPVTLELGDGPLRAQELEYAVAQSAQRSRLEPILAEHGGYVVVSVEAGGDLFENSDLLANLAAYYADDDNGLAVWLPDADYVATDVIYTNDMMDRSTLVWFNTMAAKLDESTAIAHTIGLGHLGGSEVQLVSNALDPAQAYLGLRGAVADLLDGGALPAGGMTVAIDGAQYALVTGESKIGMGAVLNLVPASELTAAQESPAEKPKRKGWFGRRK